MREKKTVGQGKKGQTPVQTSKGGGSEILHLRLDGGPVGSEALMNDRRSTKGNNTERKEPRKNDPNMLQRKDGRSVCLWHFDVRNNQKK